MSGVGATKLSWSVFYCIALCGSASLVWCCDSQDDKIFRLEHVIPFGLLLIMTFIVTVPTK